MYNAPEDPTDSKPKLKQVKRPIAAASNLVPIRQGTPEPFKAKDWVRAFEQYPYPGQKTEMVYAPTMPEGYQATHDGILRSTKGKTSEGQEYQTWQSICQPLLIIENTEDVDSRNLGYVLGCLDLDGVWRYMPVTRETAHSAHKIVELANQGLDVDSTRARQIVDYLRAFRAQNCKVIFRQKTVRRLGWVDGGVVPYGSTIQLEPPKGLGSYGAAWNRKGGSHEGQAEVIRELCKHPGALLAIGAAVASPCLEFLKQKGFVVSLVAPTSKGKTTGIQAAMGLYGDPQDLQLGWDATANAIETYLGFNRHMPIALDDTKRLNKAGRDNLASVIYAIANGEGRGRAGRQASTMRETGHWQLIGLSTGEGPLADIAGQDGGTRARVVEHWGPVIPFMERAAFEQIEREIKTHYGHLGAAWCRAIGNESEQKQIEHARQYWSRKIDFGTDEVSGRVRGYVSILLGCLEVFMKSQLALTWNDFQPPLLALVKKLEADVKAMIANARPAQRALIDIRNWIEQNRHRISGTPGAPTSKESPPQHGWIGRFLFDSESTVAILPHELTQQLERFGYVPSEILNAWKDDGTLHLKGNDSKLKQRQKWGGTNCYFYCLSLPKED